MNRIKCLHIVEDIYPLNSGNTIYSYGIMEVLSKISDLDLLTYSKFNNQKINKIYNLKLFSDLFIIKNKRLRRVLNFVFMLSSLIYLSRKTKYNLSNYFDNKIYDVVVFDHIITNKFFKIIKAHFPHSKIVYVSHNFELRNLKESFVYSKFYTNFLYRFISSAYVSLIEKKMLAVSFLRIYISNLDKILIEEYYKLGANLSNLTILPTIDFPHLDLAFDKNSKNIVFLGSMGWYPNEDGILYFINHYFNKLLKIENDWKLFIVGRNPSESVLKMASSNVIVTGEVDNVDKFISNSRFSVVPIRLGSGLKIKFHEAVVKGVITIVDKSVIDSYEIDFFPQNFILDEFDSFLKLIQSKDTKVLFDRFRNDYLLWVDSNKQQYTRMLKKLLYESN